MCNLAIFLAFGATWITMGGIIFFVCNKGADDFMLKESRKDGLL